MLGGLSKSAHAVALAHHLADLRTDIEDAESKHVVATNERVDSASQLGGAAVDG
jgi:hypothetical protein